MFVFAQRYCAKCAPTRMNSLFCYLYSESRTNEAVLELGLKPGVPATALIKASYVVMGVRD